MISSAASGSRLATGSSASSAFGRCASARAIEARCACPPDSVPARCPAKAVSPTSSRQSSACDVSWRGRRPSAVASVRCRPRVPHSTFASTLRRRTRCACWNTMPSAMRASASARPASRPMSRPATRTVPAVGRSIPAMHRSMVDLPLPLWPRITTSSPLTTDRLAPSSASRPVGCRMPRPSASIIADVTTPACSGRYAAREPGRGCRCRHRRSAAPAARHWSR